MKTANNEVGMQIQIHQVLKLKIQNKLDHSMTKTNLKIILIEIKMLMHTKLKLYIGAFIEYMIYHSAQN